MYRIFEGVPTVEQRMYILGLVTKLIYIYQEFKEIEVYEQLFRKEVASSEMLFTSAERAKYVQALKILSEFNAYNLSEIFEAMNENFLKITAYFFSDRIQQMYLPEELVEIVELRQKVLVTPYQ